MDSSKIKTFVICLLAAVNIAFLSLFIVDSCQAARLQQQIQADLYAVLLENGVELDADLPRTDKALLYPLQRDLEAEQSLAQAFLGSASGQDQGGNIYYYESADGWARFRGSGEFEITLSTALPTEGKSPSIMARQLLKKLSLPVDTEPAESQTESVLQLRYSYCAEKQPVYGCYITFSFSQDGLTSISGRRPVGAAGQADGLVEMNPSTALLALLAYGRDSGHVFGRVSALKPGYTMRVSASGSAALVPAWRIETDAGIFYVDAQSLSVELPTENL